MKAEKKCLTPCTILKIRLRGITAGTVATFAQGLNSEVPRLALVRLRIPDYLYSQLYPTAENVPKFYGLPKIHKKDAPLRPIVSSIGSVMYNTAKFLAKILRPLVGHNGHHIINSEDFTNKIADLEVSPGQTLVSYDVSALFTSIPINEAIPVVMAKLEDDLGLPDRCPLDVPQLTTLLEMCLSSTYFTYRNKEPPWGLQFHPLWPIFTWNILRAEH